RRARGTRMHNGTPPRTPLHRAQRCTKPATLSPPRPQNRPQRTVPLRQRKKIQALLPVEAPRRRGLTTPSPGRSRVGGRSEGSNSAREAKSFRKTPELFQAVTRVAGQSPWWIRTAGHSCPHGILQLETHNGNREPC